MVRFIGRNINNKQMSDFKLDISNLRPVPVEERVKDKWYIVSDLHPGNGGYAPATWHSDDWSMASDGSKFNHWKYWFEAPERPTGLSSSLPDNFEISPTEWEYEREPGKWCKVSTVMRKFRRVIVPCREIVIPTAGRDDQIRMLQEKLNELRGVK